MNPALAVSPDLSWTAASARDQAAIKAFLTVHEAWACGCSDKVRTARLGKRFLTGQKTLLAMGRDRNGQLDSLVLFSASSLVFPVLSPLALAQPASLESLRAFAGGPGGYGRVRPHSCIGLRDQVQALETAFGWRPQVGVNYFAMAQGDPEELLTVAAAPRPERRLPGLSVRLAVATDLAALLPLACAYDREEVLTANHAFNAEWCRAAQVNSLRHFTVILAELDGRAIGRVQTNAVGYSREQIGGVYVAPTWRGRGVARAMMSLMLAELGRRGRLASLFVKRRNQVAIGLYESLGFRKVADYRVDYF
ncbi:MAG: hypothetical protein A2087_08750 [Spirochaetes bacterium GWD1_61_31]|nr:MAG: hypothetical protein A2Y37_14435 [Spirochaetes bacterium GWB1_60_80]OHD32376.1 MAG: hypothetical protein A2004_06385 [Spirochaetes bacterium GWC1_61_12]OHD38057.1 MAG: hypothetical protein A2087_08750 [Spirochaetes bacterium GWD1_61_31]OHD44543.1 MAG: hypothetical protein A2Y35_05275 [Spirochaetes bacterium GWE1_60_18]OHD58669.1 MAG: hypothetical protein A2Y32_03340 [Spirochaetes bacterium GWF1_60_12]HAP43199.1 hypothetical protein [Spirochaetaceae bacterium]